MIKLKELKNQFEVLKDEYLEKQRNLQKRFALENCNIQIGDVLTDHYHTIKAETYDISFDCDGTPYMVFYGPELKKDGTPCKRQSGAPVHQINIKFVNGKEYNFKDIIN